MQLRWMCFYSSPEPLPLSSSFNGALTEPRLLLKERGSMEEALRAGPPGGGSGKPDSSEGLVGRVGFRTYRRKDRQVKGGASMRRVVGNPGVILL